MLVFIVLCSIATGVGASGCYGLDRTSNSWSELTVITAGTSLPITDGQNANLTCTIGQLSGWSEAVCSTSTLVPFNGTGASDSYPTCTIGSLVCNSDGTISYTFDSSIITLSDISVLFVNMTDNTEHSCGDAQFAPDGLEYNFDANKCYPKHDIDADKVTIEHKLKVSYGKKVNDPNTGEILFTSPSVTIDTKCTFPSTIQTNVSAWKIAGAEVDTKDGTSEISFTFEKLTTSGLDNGRYKVVAGEDIVFKISSSDAVTAGVKFYLWKLDVEQSDSSNIITTIVKDGCASDGTAGIKFSVAESDKAISNTDYEFTLQAFELADTSVEFDLEATIKICAPAKCSGAPLCPPIGLGHLTIAVFDAETVRKRRQSKQLEAQDEIRLSTGPFVFQSKDQISGAKAIGWMLPLTIFNILLFLQYL